MTAWLGWVGNAVILAGMWGIGGKHRWAFLVTALGEAIWTVQGLALDLPDLSIICALFTIMALVNWRRWSDET